MKERASSFKSGFAALVGRPNVGKSTLVNKLVGEKIAIVSDKPQTTRNKIMCVLTTDNMQAVFIDTPGIHKPRHKLGEFMVKAAERALDEVNVALFLAEANAGPGGGDEYIMDKLSRASAPVILVLNKIDRLADKSALLPIIDRYAAKMDFCAVIPLSALRDRDFSALLTEVARHLPLGPQYFPGDMLTDQPERILAAELIREKLIARATDEVPHALAVDIEEMKTRANRDIYIRAAIYVERASQKGIIIGAGGGRLKAAGQAARADIEALLGGKVYLDLWVSVKADWRNRPSLFKNFGFE
jgi:GTP-binding protein Era